MSGHGKTYWRSLEDYADTPEFREFMFREFPAGATDMLDSDERRSFLKIMGASLALAGFGLSGCRRWPKEQIAPFANRPDSRAPGVPVQYATSMERGGFAQGLLVTSFDGRPTKIEGNPQHPISGGATDGWAQASVLELYDPDRSRRPMQAGEQQRARRTFAELDKWIDQHFGGLKGARGSGLAVLGEATESPSVLDMKARFLEAFPRAAWYEYEPVNNDNEVVGTTRAFGDPHRPHYAFDRAQVIVSLDSDFLYHHPAAVKHTRDFAAARRTAGPQATMSRLYAFESALTLTGANADHRFPVRSADVAAVAGWLAGRLLPDAAPVDAPQGVPLAALQQVVRDLQDHRRRGLVVAGPRQPVEVHVLAAALNEQLGNVGTTVSYSRQPDAKPHVAEMRSLVQAMAGGDVQTLVIVGGNPVYDAPADLDFSGHLDKLRTSVHLSHYDNETSRRCTWHVPRAHCLEAWGDARAWDGTWSIVQPLIEPLFGGRSTIELLAQITGETTATGYTVTRRTLSEWIGGRDFERTWRKALHDGYFGTPATLEDPAVDQGAAAAALDQLRQRPAAGGAVEIVFVPDAKVYDGRYANNGWLQELPDPITKLTWDNAVIVGVEAARRLGVRDGDLLRVAAGRREVTGPALVLPGQHSGSVTLPLGYGVSFGIVAEGAGFDACALRGSDAMGFTSGTVEKAGGRATLAMTQDHHAIDTTGGKGTQDRLPALFREASLEAYRKNPRFAHDHERTGVEVVHRLSLWPENNLQGAQYAWGMTIDLSACTGCSACVVACQAENNIPIVGKDQVKRGRELHWIRVDRYFKGRDAGYPESYALQPVPCMQCENAPCEQVCPVAATTHDKDGINVMVYNRCVGTRYCSNNCPYKVRRFNYFDYWTRRPVRERGLVHVDADYYTRPPTDVNELQKLQLNPEVTVRSRGVMEKCTYCIQRISAAKVTAKNEWVKRPAAEKKADPRVVVPDGSFTTACAQACPAEAIVFGDLMDKSSAVAKSQMRDRSYGMLAEINTEPRTKYLAKVRNPAPALAPAHPVAEEADHG